MLRPYFLFAGLALSLPCSAFAQTSGLGGQLHSTQSLPSNFSTSGQPTVSLMQSHVAAPSSDVRFSPLPSDVTYAFRANLAQSFQQEQSGLLLEPRLTKYSSSDAAIQGYSAEIRIGNVRFERSDSKPSGWYVFAATDGEALSMNTKSITGSRDSMTVTLVDQITVGDLQAGISTYVADGTQLTFSYIETEASFSASGGMSNSKKESFAGISLSKEF